MSSYGDRGYYEEMYHMRNEYEEWVWSEKDSAENVTCPHNWEKEYILGQFFLLRCAECKKLQDED